VAEHVSEINTQNFKTEVLESELPVLVDFWAEWCMPCRMISPIIDELSAGYKGKVKFAKVNVDNNTDLATELQILSIPQLILFRNGKEITRMTGANPKEFIQREIDTALSR
jgi:thioredoxin 1